MGQLRLPEGAEAGFRLVDADEFGPVFTMHLYGAGRHGWFLLHSQYALSNHDPGPRPLGKGQWRTWLNFVKQARFWELPEQWPHPWPDNVTVDGGESLDLTGRDSERHHRIHRFIWREPGLNQVLAFCRRSSGLFVQHPVSGFWVPAAWFETTTPQPEG